ncbi:MAG: hypothetical protein ACR2H3_08115 [Acidimicrobiales bacterium]
MAKVTVTPEEYYLVSFDSSEIAAIISKVADDVGLPSDAPIDVIVDEATPLGRATLASVDPVRLEVEGGAFEDPTNPRTMSERLVRDVVGRLLGRAADRRSAAFADAPSEADLTLPQLTAWDAACMGRLERKGYDMRKPRRQYHFRNRHGFNDVADAAFERLWASDDVTWADITTACALTEAVGQSA